MTILFKYLLSKLLASMLFVPSPDIASLFYFYILVNSDFVFVLAILVILISLSANPIKLSNTLKQFVGNLPTNCLSVSNYFLGGQRLKGYIDESNEIPLAILKRIYR